MGQKTAEEILAAAFGFTPAEILPEKRSWCRPFKELMVFDPARKAWALDLGWDREEHRKQLVATINHEVRELTEGKVPKAFMFSAQGDGDRVEALIDLPTLQKIATTKKEADSGMKGYFEIDYYTNYLRGAVSALSKKALGLKANAKNPKWRTNDFLASAVLNQDTKKAKSGDFFLIFTSGYTYKHNSAFDVWDGVLFRQLRREYVRLGRHLLNHAVLNDEQTAAVQQVFSKSGKHSLIKWVRDKKHNETYLAFNPEPLGVLFNAGIILNPLPTLDHYFRRDKVHYSAYQNGSMDRAFCTGTGINVEKSDAAKLYEKVEPAGGLSECYFHFQPGTYLVRNGRLHKSSFDKKDSEVETEGVEISFNFLNRYQARKFQKDITKHWQNELAKAGYSGDAPLPSFLRSSLSGRGLSDAEWGYKIYFPYAPIDALLKQGKKIDLLPPLQRCHKLQKTFFDRTAKIEESFCEVFGLPAGLHGLQFPSTFPRNFLQESMSSIDRIQLQFERSILTTKENYNKRESCYDDLKVRAKKVLVGARLARSVKIWGGAISYAGGVNNHHCYWEIPFKSLSHAEGLATRFMAKKDILQPLIAEFFAISGYSYALRNFLPDSSDATEKRRRALCSDYKKVGEEVLKSSTGQDAQTALALPAQDLLTFEPTLGQVIEFLVKHRSSFQTSVKATAETCLANLTPLSPHIPYLIAKAPPAQPALM